MNKNKKITLIISIALVSIVLLIGVTYALNYTQTGTNQELVLGDIWMKYEEKNGLLISDAVPGSDYSNYFEFTISGTNTYTKKDIYYDFLITKGDLPDGKSEDYRIPDEYLKFKLVSVDNNSQETEIFTDKTYTSLENTRIYVETIGKGVTNYSKTYRLYMTIDNRLLIGNSSDAVFTFSEWESAFASIKVNVTGDFNEKELPPSGENCYNAGKTLKDFTINTSSEAVATCVTYVTEQGFTFNEGESAEAYCNGTGTGEGTLLYDDILYAGDTSINYTWYGITRSYKLEKSDLEYFINNNIITNIEYGATIIGYEESCGNDVVIPNTIAGYPVVKIDRYAVSFESLTTSNAINQAMSTVCGYADEEAPFFRMNITSVVIPNSVFYIGVGAFEATDDLKRVTMGNNIRYIDASAFGIYLDRTYEIDKTCNEIASIPTKYTNPTTYHFNFSNRNYTVYGYENGVKTLCE